ncbi:MAG: 16S rRNA (adenine(1518)-N(6)/adenine(1519)-N(6))-dimethyltransferase RsmA [Patescibacteria group bacterium]|nr:16S rRNA (adenine(1518)-N(6)/adenine(1519)-N(6))-dimethyltransferase RsmA [Patescibacteria group bacterium]
MGQNFLINEAVLEKIVRAADLRADDCVLEIGPGFGILTEELIEKVKKVLAIELDKRLVYFLKQKFKRQNNLEILQSDVLKIKNQEIFDKLAGGSGGYKIVANLPYNITGAALKKFLSYNPKPTEMILLLQKEVAQRILAKPRKMSLLSLSVQFYGEAELVSLVSKESFYPRPKVDSAIIKIRIKKEAISGLVENEFWRLARIGFSSPRKQLQNNLSSGLKIDKEKAKNALKYAKLEPNCRPSDLNLAQWISLYQKIMV